jgi:flagellar hook protein FlgE
MSLYGALFGGVSGLRAQSSQIGAISDNIANVNTIGYKQARAAFQSLVVNTSSNVSFQTGGVRSTTIYEVSRQGLLASTDSSTDIAISGGGFFTVRRTAEVIAGDTSSLPLFTRAGSFRQDELGNFVNTQGFFLQGWPLDRNGRLPGEPGNLNTTAFTNFDSLETVNIEAASGIANATTTIELGANLDAGVRVFPGQDVGLTPDINDANNFNVNAEAILGGAEFGLATANNLNRADRFEVATGLGLSFTYEYGGYTTGRSIAVAGPTNFGDNQIDNTAQVPLGAAAGAIQFGPTANTFTINFPAGHNLIVGDVVNMSGIPGAGLGATPQAELLAPLTVTQVGSLSQIVVSVSTPHGGVLGAGANPGGVSVDNRIFVGNVFDAITPTQPFLGSTTTLGFTAGALNFTISTPSIGTTTFRYVNGSPNAVNGEFNSLNTLAQSITEVNGLSARVVDNRLLVSSEDASESVTFANGDTTGTTALRGIDWVSELGFQNIPTGSRRFNSIQGLANLINSDGGVSAEVLNPLSNSSLTVRVDDPLDTITLRDLPDLPFSVPTAGTPVSVPAGVFTAGAAIDIVITDAGLPPTLNLGDQVNIRGLTAGTGGLPLTLPNGGPFDVVGVTPGVSYTVRLIAPSNVTLVGGNFAAPANNSVNIIGESNLGSVTSTLGATPSLNGAAFTPQSTGVLGPRYDSSGTVGQNLASGDITAQFSRNVRIFDNLGAGHDIRYSFIKVAANTWAAEVHVIPPTDINAALPDGQIATGTVSFNGDGSLRSVSSGLTNAVTINWNNGSLPSSVDLDLGTAGQPFGTTGASVIGLTDGLSQFNSSFNVRFANQNGAPVGQLVSVSIDNDGLLIASFSNGESQALFQLPIADFASPEGLNPLSGNVYSQSRDSGEANLREAGTNGVGTVVSNALEQANVDLAEELTNMIIAQRSYQANTRVIRTTDELLEQLTQL